MIPQRRFRPTLRELYRNAHGGNVPGLEEDLDAAYALLFPPPFTPEKPASIQHGHVALLELFTDSGCPPCVGGDIAAEALLEQYSRTDLVVLSFDQHQPLPDPLANPDSVARAALYQQVGTPRFVLDGIPLSYSGGSREESKEVHAALEKSVAGEISIKSDVQLSLTAPMTPSGQVETEAKVTTGTELETSKLLSSTKTSATPIDDEAKRADVVPASQAPSHANAEHLIINFVLVEDPVRYSGENGVRFHRMVVRSLAKPADSGFPLGFATTTAAETSFDPSAISAKLHDYLIGYGHANEQFFGPVEWRSTDTVLNSQHLVVVAWVQDAATHRVLQAAIAIPIEKSPQSEITAKE